MDKAIAYLQSQHPWLTYAQAFALLEYAWHKNAPSDKYSGMAKTLLSMDIDIFGRATADELKDRLAYIYEYGTKGLA